MGPWFGRGGDRDRATAGRECLDAPLAGRSTPFLLVDEQVLTDNIRAMADLARRRGCRLRPHAKTHKSPDIARLQLDAGAVGLTVATLGEAEVFAAAGFADLFVAYPLWVDRARGARLRALRRTASVLVGVDSEAGVRALSTEAPGTAVLVEVDSGQHRSGTAPERTGELARLARSSGLAVRGVFTFPGHGYHPDRRHEAAAQEADALGRAVGSMSAAGVTAAVVS
ncbi:MAG: alanine racemase, partial [Nocardioidaceae bacterium]